MSTPSDVPTETAASSDEPTTLAEVFALMEQTSEESWNPDIVRSLDGTENCFFGHLFSMGEDDRAGNRLWDWFESR